MKEKLKRNILSASAKIIHTVTVNSVNSACNVIWGQEKEPKSLSRFKKNEIK